jgi:peptidase S41-like protein
MADATLEQRVQWLQNGLREIGKMCLRLGADGGVAPAQPPLPPQSIPPVVPAANVSSQAAAGPGENVPVPIAAIPLSQFLANVQPLTPAERLAVVEAAITMLDGVFVHLPLKRAMHGIDPLQRLRLLKYRLEAQIADDEAERSDRGFHDEMIEIFHSLRDLHTNYILPVSYQGQTAFLPFLVEEYFDGNPPERHYIVTRIQPGFTHPTFQVGVTVTHWNGIPVDRAVELNAAREAGSNADARHARGLEALTLRPMALTAPPDEAWVIIGYESGGQKLELRLEWQVTAPPPSPSGADVNDPLGVAGEAARVMGFDAQTEAVRRARKSIFDRAAMDREQRMAQVVATAGAPAGLAGATGAAPASESSGVASGVFSNDARAEEFRKGRRTVLFPAHKSAQEGVNAAAAAATAGSPAVVGAPAGEGSETTSLLPDFFSFRPVPTARGVFGYIRIYSFMIYDASAFVAEFARIAALLPQNGLIVDVRKNGGGNINAGERLLQILSPQPIDPERFHFINTPTTRALCNGDASLKSWAESIDLAVQTGETYSQGFPLTSLENGTGVTYRYPGKVVLVVDALCYSTTDIFAAGFQDNNLGKILGTSGHTGAGGANVWPYDFFLNLPGFNALPKGVKFRTAIRRSTRVRAKAGVPLEDLGVQPDKQHRMTRKDVLQSNADLIEEAASFL